MTTDDATIRELLLDAIRAPSPDASSAERTRGDAWRADEIHRRLAPLRDASRLELSSLRRNGRRVDVRMHSADERAWLVVVWFVDASLERIESVTVYPRPAAFSGRAGGAVVVLNGPSSVGKSSLMRAFAERAETPFAYFDEPVLGQLPPNYRAWPETAGPHVAGVLVAIAASARLGNQFVMSAAGIGQEPFRAAFGGVPTAYVGLDAPLPVLIERQVSQQDKFGGLAEESTGIHEGWEYDLRIDTVQHDPVDASRLLVEHLRAKYERPV